jgi:nitrous oxidase accessory protein
MTQVGRGVALAAALSASWALSAPAVPAPPVPASRASPLQALIDAAPTGATIVLPRGIFAGPLVVDKRIAIVGSGATEIVVGEEGGDPALEGNAISVIADGASISGLVVRGSGSSLRSMDAGIYLRGRGLRLEGCKVRGALFGMRLDGCSDCEIAGCAISGRAGSPYAERGDGIRVTGGSGNSISDARISSVCDGIYLDGSERPRVLRASISDGRYGIHVMYGRGADIVGARAERMVVGAMVMGTKRARISGGRFEDGRDPRGAALVLFESEDCACEGNILSGAQRGVVLDGARRCRVEGNLVSANARGISIDGVCTGTEVVGNGFFGNARAVDGSAKAGTIAWSEDGKGNYWDDYKGYDLDGNGIGDTPYRRPRTFSALRAREELTAVFFGSPLQRALDDFGLEAEVVDTSPLMFPPVGAANAGSACE